MKRKNLMKVIDELGIKIESDRTLTKTELVWAINHHAFHLAAQMEILEAKRDQYEKVSQNLMAIVVRYPETRADLAESIRSNLEG